MSSVSPQPPAEAFSINHADLLSIARLEQLQNQVYEELLQALQLLRAKQQQQDTDIQLCTELRAILKSGDPILRLPSPPPLALDNVMQLDSLPVAPPPHEFAELPSDEQNKPAPKPGELIKSSFRIDEQGFHWL